MRLETNCSFMKSRYFQGMGLVALLAGVCLAGTTEVFAQRVGGGGGGSFGGGGRGGGGGGGGGSAGAGRSTSRTYYPQGVIGDAVISSDPETHSLIVISDDETSEAISRVITNLDRPTPQVLIKVAFLEATYTDTKDIGLEASYTHHLSSTTTGIVSSVFGVAQQLAAGGATGTGQGAFYQIMGANFAATLHALATAGKTEVLSRPSILARNNQLATITVGQSVPIINGTVVGALGTQSSTYQYQDIGIILRVTPYITSDGLVQMIISPEITSLTDQTVSMGQGVNVPVIAKRAADTVVVTPDGQPVIIGGLMQNQKIDSVSKVPILGDIPLLGLAFQRHQKNDQKTELIIILTPHIVYSPTQLASMSDRERQAAQNIPKAFSERELDRYIDGLPVKRDGVPNAKPGSYIQPAPSTRNAPNNSPLVSPNQRDN